MSNTILTLAEIEAAMEGSRTRGEYLPAIKAFFSTGELAVDMSAKFPGKVAASLRNSVEQNAKRAVEGTNSPAYKVVLNGEKGSESVILINLDALAAAKLAAEAAEATVE